MSDTVQKEGLDAETIRKYEAEYVLTPWTAQKGLNPFVAAKAKGCWVYNKEGRKYLDLTSQFVFTNLGHCDDRVNAAIAKQAALLASVNSQWATEPKARLGKLLAEVTPGDLKKSFFSTGGTEANEGAIKIARWATGKQKVLSRWRSYHGSTMGAMAVSADYRNWCAEPAVPGAVHILPPYCYRCHFGATYPSCDIQCAKHVEDVIRLEGGARRVAAVIGEPIFGAGGIIVPPDEYWPMVRAICDKYEVVLIADEIMTAFGRTGKWFGMDNWGVVPDIMTLAKGINSGAVPLGATVVRPWLAEKFETQPYLHGHTYSGHALSMAAAVATIEAYQQDKLIDQAAKTGAYLMNKLKALQEKHPCIGEVRGKGLFCGIEIVKNRQTKEPIHEALMEPPRPATAKMKFLGKCMEEGVYIMPGGASVITFSPPLAITTEELDFGLDVIDRNLAICDADYQK
ncbi:MAG: aspartate aminotransferase family protein [Deltaproteobacteria bacterium]|nr:MAG: aspartate aminotransferase family protein [Deltaproteobacteria bacterium]RPJ12130.1 MAG: aspartate aminotransferase family protein [Deltaproteobacteria bacterium]